jgi:soluble lytic murein transglycosylase-like protein
MPDLMQLLRGALPPAPAAPAKRQNTLDPQVLGIPKPPPVRIDDPDGRLSGTYDRELLQNIANEAKLTGVDPATALAMAGQETTFGRYGAGPDNPFHLDKFYHGDHPLGNITGALEYFKKRSSQFPDDEELAIQSYNGLGKIQGGSEVEPDTPMYGGQTALHGLRDRPYGKAIIKLREMLLQQPDIQGLIKR